MQINMNFFLTCGRQARLIFSFNILIILLVLILNRSILNKLNYFLKSCDSGYLKSLKNHIACLRPYACKELGNFACSGFAWAEHLTRTEQSCWSPLGAPLQLNSQWVNISITGKYNTM